MSRTFLTAEWRKLIMAQYTVDPAILAPYLPPGTELDLFQGECLVSLVGFMFRKVRVLGLPIPGHINFEEVNLRFYVRRAEPDGTSKRGVVFIREIVPRAAITLIANVLYEEPYATMPMRHRIEHTASALEVSYEWRDRGTWFCIDATAGPGPVPIQPGSVEHFITDHFWGYTRRRRGSTSQYEVRHPDWVVYPIRTCGIEADFAQLYGPAFAGLNRQQPTSILLAEGSPVSVQQGTRLP